MVKSLRLLWGRQGRRDERDDSEVGYHRNLPALPALSAVSVVSVVSALSKELISREAHLTFSLSLFRLLYRHSIFAEAKRR